MRNITTIRLGIAFLAATIVTMACLMVVLAGGGGYVNYEQSGHVENLKITNEAIQIYRKQKGKLPRSLSDLSSVTDIALRMRDGKVLNIWDHAIEYRAQGEKYDLISYGRDGKPGGVGFDADLSLSNPYSLEERPTLSQIISHPMNRTMVWTAVISGLLTFGLAFWLVKPKDLSSQRIFLLAVKMVFTLLATAYFAACITSLHVPSGH